MVKKDITIVVVSLRAARPASQDTGHRCPIAEKAAQNGRNQVWSLVNPSLVLPVLSLVLGEPSLIRRDLGLIRSDLSLDPVILTLVWSDLSLDRADLSLVLCDLSLIRPKLSLVPVILTWDLAIPPAFVPFPFKAAAVPSRGQCGASGRSSCESSSAAQGQVRGAVAARF